MRNILIVSICLLSVSGCAPSAQNDKQLLRTNPQNTSSDDAVFDEFEEELSQNQVKIADPIKPINRIMHNFNDFLLTWIFNPVEKTYALIVPKLARIGIDNFFHNVTTPVRLVNCLLQGKPSAAGRELHRFALNTTVGVFGFGDPAKDHWNIEPAEEDLGQTLGVYGIDNGFYIVLPFLGPSTGRDSVGMIGDAFLNPVRYVEPVELSIGISTEDKINNGSLHIGEYESIKAASVDPYIAIRDAYIQYRNKKIKE